MIEKQKPGKVLMLPVDAIEPSPWQARTAFDETEIAALAVSILQNGLLQPISVRRVGLHKYQLIAGERRLRACRLAKLEKVPAILSDWTDSESAALGLLENIQRSQLDPFDTARGIREVIRLWGCTQAEAARRLGLSQPALANKLRLLSLTPTQQQICTAHHLTERHARAVLRLPENRRTAALEKVARDGLSVRETDKLVDTMLTAPPGTPSPCRKTTPMVRDVRLFVNTLQHAVDLMTQKGIPATTTCGRRDGCLEYVVRIPVEGADTSLPLPQTFGAVKASARPAGKLRPVDPAGECPTNPVLPDSSVSVSDPLPGGLPGLEGFSPVPDALAGPADRGPGRDAPGPAAANPAKASALFAGPGAAPRPEMLDPLFGPAGEESGPEDLQTGAAATAPNNPGTGQTGPEPPVASLSRAKPAAHPGPHQPVMPPPARMPPRMETIARAGAAAPVLSHPVRTGPAPVVPAVPAGPEDRPQTEFSRPGAGQADPVQPQARTSAACAAPETKRTDPEQPDPLVTASPNRPQPDPAPDGELPDTGVTVASLTRQG